MERKSVWQQPTWEAQIETAQDNGSIQRDIIWNFLWDLAVKEIISDEQRHEIYKAVLVYGHDMFELGQHETTIAVSAKVGWAFESLTRHGNLRWTIDAFLKLNEYGFNLEIPKDNFFDATKQEKEI